MDGIYADIPEFNLGDEYAKLLEDNRILTSHIIKLQSDVTKLMDAVISLKSQQKNLTHNISELYKTAKRELLAKDALISDLRRELDDLKFRRFNRPPADDFNQECKRLKLTIESENSTNVEHRDDERLQHPNKVLCNTVEEVKTLYEKHEDGFNSDRHTRSRSPLDRYRISRNRGNNCRGNRNHFVPRRRGRSRSRDIYYEKRPRSPSNGNYVRCKSVSRKKFNFEKSVSPERVETYGEYLRSKSTARNSFKLEKSASPVRRDEQRFKVEKSISPQRHGDTSRIRSKSVLRSYFKVEKSVSPERRNYASRARSKSVLRTDFKLEKSPLREEHSSRNRSKSIARNDFKLEKSLSPERREERSRYFRSKSVVRHTFKREPSASSERFSDRSHRSRSRESGRRSHDRSRKDCPYSAKRINLKEYRQRISETERDLPDNIKQEMEIENKKVSKKIGKEISCDQSFVKEIKQETDNGLYDIKENFTDKKDHNIKSTENKIGKDFTAQKKDRKNSTEHKAGKQRNDNQSVSNKEKNSTEYKSNKKKNDILPNELRNSEKISEDERISNKVLSILSKVKDSIDHKSSKKIIDPVSAGFNHSIKDNKIVEPNKDQENNTAHSNVESIKDHKINPAHSNIDMSILKVQLMYGACKDPKYFSTFDDSISKRPQDIPQALEQNPIASMRPIDSSTESKSNLDNDRSSADYCYQSLHNVTNGNINSPDVLAISESISKDLNTVSNEHLKMDNKSVSLNASEISNTSIISNNDNSTPDRVNVSKRNTVRRRRCIVTIKADT